VDKIYKILLVIIILFICVTVFVCFNYFLKNKDIKKIDLSADKIATASVSVPTISLPAPIKTFNILIVPGHDVKDGGANYKNLYYERDLAAIIGGKIADIFNKADGYNITVARDTNSWNPIFSIYFQNERQEIIDWKNQCQANEKSSIASGKEKIVQEMGMPSEVTPDMSVKLYGINKWANENNIDLVLNLHFNDEERPNMNAPGNLTGFNIFIPESQMKNSAVSRLIAQNVYNELKIIEPSESGELLEDQNLIALGASGTLNAPSMLIEYAYIYEKKLRDDATRQETLDQMALQTAIGIENYVNANTRTTN